MKYSLITRDILLLFKVEGVAMMTMPVNFSPSPFVVKLSPLFSSEGVVAEELLSVGVEDIAPKGFYQSVQSDQSTFSLFPLRPLALRAHQLHLFILHLFILQQSVS